MNILRRRVLTDEDKIALAEANGILMPRRAMIAARWAGIPYWAMCALLVKESSGGRNVYGRDQGPHWLFYDHGEVTECNYAAYVIERDRTGRRQGVGPCQLTGEDWQDEADELGGCWRPVVNMKTAAKRIKEWRREGLTWRQVWLRYSGGKVDYADAMDVLCKKFRKLMKGQG